MLLKSFSQQAMVRYQIIFELQMLSLNNLVDNLLNICILAKLLKVWQMKPVKNILSWKYILSDQFYIIIVCQVTF